MISRPEHLDVSCPTIAGIGSNTAGSHSYSHQLDSVSTWELVNVGMLRDVYLPNFEDTLTMFDLDIKHLHSMVPNITCLSCFIPY